MECSPNRGNGRYPQRREATLKIGSMPEPIRPAHLDRTLYRSVHFFGRTLDVALQSAAEYIQHVSKTTGQHPHVLCMHEEFSIEDEENGLAWRLTLVLGDVPDEPENWY